MSTYHSKPVDSDGYVAWDDDEHRVWRDLVQRQMSVISGRACQDYIDGLSRLALSVDQVPQLPDVNRVLKETTGWCCEPVPALINFDRFFGLLAEKKFPVATFLRRRQEFDYLQEPDYFHEIFGHCAMLTHPDFASFTHAYGRLGSQATHQQRVYLARLYWFTVEFGLVKEDGKMKIYGGGILSSPGESISALEGEGIERHPFDVESVLRTPYRIDIMQPIYYYLDSINDLFALSQRDLMADVVRAQAKPLFHPLFNVKQI
ncbi:phenylalanine 4-monooxygenase [Thaumasiovibrio sp. DFM-14]|uniref:phenylalanine 4-monooxygenase n=1 Tax=Thaumasiovibrio sp. DFM-14 TaxID=3384792 RepID=UPI0039A306D4